MARADYTYRIEEILGRNCILITDLNMGNMSVTNDIENVVKEIGAKENIDPSSYMIIYKDSDLVWDGWDNNKGVFIHLGADYHLAAVKRFIDHQLN